MMDDSTEKDQQREEDQNMWGCGLPPQPHINASVPLEGIFFSALMD
jgi:hypothetical protein